MMCILALVLGLLAVETDANGLRTARLEDPEFGLSAIVVTIGVEDNEGFSVLDVPVRSDGENIQTHWAPDRFVLMINGGYFQPDYTPAGYCKIDNKTLNANRSRRYSGFVAIDNEGRLSLHTRNDALDGFPTVLQVGPYVIDPGGTVGIRTRSEEKAARTLIGMTREQELVIAVTGPISLYDLAQGFKKHMPSLERLLNLDGGPSTALKTQNQEVLNAWPVRNYIVKGRDSEAAPQK